MEVCQLRGDMPNYGLSSGQSKLEVLVIPLLNWTSVTLSGVSFIYLL